MHAVTRSLALLTVLLASSAAWPQPNLTADLMVAAGNGDAAQVTALLDRGADVNALDSLGFSALMYAAKSGSTGTVKLLLARGADAKVRATMFGYTALMNAAAFGDVEMVEALLAKGAGVNVRDGQGATALTFAEQAGKADIVKLLKARGGTK